MRTQLKRRPPHGGRTDTLTHAADVLSRPVTAMGLSFANPLGLAAGFDRTGALIPSLSGHGFGHIEVGTITPASGYAGSLGRRNARIPIGINIGSARAGLDETVIEDYTAMLRQVYGFSDYIVANLSAPALARNGDMRGLETLVKRLGLARDVLSAVGGRRVPLLLKFEAGRHGTTFPAALLTMRAAGIDGAVLVSDSVERIRAIAGYLDGLTVISVGGVTSAEDVRARLAAGAKLVQMHRAYADGGVVAVRSILKGAPVAVERHV